MRFNPGATRQQSWNDASWNFSPGKPQLPKLLVNNARKGGRGARRTIASRVGRDIESGVEKESKGQQNLPDRGPCRPKWFLLRSILFDESRITRGSSERNLRCGSAALQVDVGSDSAEVPPHDASRRFKSSRACPETCRRVQMFNGNTQTRSKLRPVPIVQNVQSLRSVQVVQAVQELPHIIVLLKGVPNVQKACPESYRRVQSLRSAKIRSLFKMFKPFNRYAMFKP